MAAHLEFHHASAGLTCHLRVLIDPAEVSSAVHLEAEVKDDWPNLALRGFAQLDLEEVSFVDDHELGVMSVSPVLDPFEVVEKARQQAWTAQPVRRHGLARLVEDAFA